MRTIAKLFGKSPFAPLQTHMKNVASCVDKLSTIFESLPSIDKEKIEKLVSELSKLEHEADLTKNDIRNHLPKSLFLPIDRGQLLEILALQDSIADKAEDIGISLTLRPLEPFGDFVEQLQDLYRKNNEVFQGAKKIIAEIDELLESSFGGLEAEKVKAMVEDIAYKEYESGKMQHKLLRHLFQEGAKLSAPSFTLWLRLIEEVGGLATLSEKLANRIRMVLEIK